MGTGFQGSRGPAGVACAMGGKDAGGPLLSTGALMAKRKKLKPDISWSTTEQIAVHGYDRASAGIAGTLCKRG